MHLFCLLSGTGHSQHDSRESVRTNHVQLNPYFLARQADSRESLECPIRANHPVRANRANRFARITPLSLPPIHGLCAFFKPLLTPVSTAPFLPASQFTVCTSRFTHPHPPASQFQFRHLYCCDPEVALQTPKLRKIQRHEKVTQKSKWGLSNGRLKSLLRFVCNRLQLGTFVAFWATKLSWQNDVNCRQSWEIVDKCLKA